MSWEEPFSRGEDRLECPACGTHNRLDTEQCWNCGADVGPSNRIEYESGTFWRRDEGPPSSEETRR